MSPILQRLLSFGFTGLQNTPCNSTLDLLTFGSRELPPHSPTLIKRCVSVWIIEFGSLLVA